MRSPLSLLAAALAGLAFAPAVAAATTSAQRTLAVSLGRDMAAAKGHSSALVVDLTSGERLFSWNPGTGRMPASIEKLYTTTTLLTRFGPSATLTTQLLGTGSETAGGVWRGTLYLRGGGDPTFGSAAFDHANYGMGATVERLVADLLRSTPIKTLQGSIAGDESLFDSLRGTPPYGYAFNPDEEGSLSALTFNRDVNSTWTAAPGDPPVFAAQALASALEAAHVRLTRVRETSAGTPAAAQPMAEVHSPSMSSLVYLTNSPSDNFFAEMLLKDLGARYGAGGTTAAGAAVVRAQLARWGIHPSLEDGSGLSRRDRTSPLQVVNLLARFAANRAFVASLPIAGRTGTLQKRMRGTVAQGRCEAKTGTLHDASDLAGYCHARDGHTLAFALLMNAVDPAYVHVFQDRAAESLAAYDG